MKSRNLNQSFFGLTFISTSEETNGKYFQSSTMIPAGDPGPPPHIHSKEDEGFYVKSGELTFIINDEEVVVKEGEYINIEKGEKHSWRNDSNSATELIITFSPAGIEKMFEELDENPSNILEIGKKYGTDFLL